MSDFNFSHLSDTDLVDIIIVEHYRNEEDYQQALLNELKNRNIDINRFNDDNSYIQSFINGFPGGWNIEIKSMFDELQATDWNKSMYIQAKEKYGEFHFSGGNLSDEHIKIIKAHEEIINATCSRCGGKEYVSSNNGHWIEILCRNVLKAIWHQKEFIIFRNKDLPIPELMVRIRICFGGIFPMYSLIFRKSTSLSLLIPIGLSKVIMV